MKVLAVVLAVTIFSGACGSISLNTGKGNDDRSVTRSVHKLISEKKFSEAKELLQSRDQGKSPTPELVAEVIAAESCAQAFDAAASPPESRSKRKDIAGNLRTACARDKSFSKAIGAAKRLEEGVHDLPFEPTGSGPLAIALAAAQNRCRDGMRWFFVKLKEPVRQDRRVIFTSGDLLVGPFERMDQCEEARLKLPPELKPSWSKPENCQQKYVDKPETAEIVEAAYMVSAGHGNMEKTVLAFSSEEICREAVSKPYLIGGQTINPLGSREINRFIEGCRHRSVKVCSEPGGTELSDKVQEVEFAH
jgi:hypothetical protein